MFIDELNAMCPRRESSNNEVEKRVIACLVSQFDAMVSFSFIIGRSVINSYIFIFFNHVLSYLTLIELPGRYSISGIDLGCDIFPRNMHLKLQT